MTHRIGSDAPLPLSGIQHIFGRDKACTVATSFLSLPQGRSKEDEEENVEGIGSQMSG